VRKALFEILGDSKQSQAQSSTEKGHILLGKEKTKEYEAVKPAKCMQMKRERGHYRA